MSDVKVTNLASFDASVQGWFARVREAAAEAAVGLAHETFETVLEYGPQYSGDFVANTNVSVNGAEPAFVVGLGGGHGEVGMGSPGAMNIARSRANWPTIKLGDRVVISSSAKHDESYAWKIERGEIPLRPINQGADHVYRRAVAATQHRYARIGSVQLAALRKHDK